MAVVLELKPDVERRVTEQAVSRGVSVESFLTSLIEQAVLLSGPPDATLEEFEADMDSLAEGSDDLPVLPPGAFSRESIYGDHD
jgi:hypothetical protein